MAGLGVVEDKSGAGWLFGDVSDGSAEGIEGEVGDYSKPGEEGRERGIVARGEELRGQGLAFEVDRHVREVEWDRQACGGEEFALPLLGREMIDLEDAEVGIWVTVREGVEAGAEQNVLGHSTQDSLGEKVFGVAAARDEEGAQPDREWAAFQVGIKAWCAVELRGVRAEDWDRYWIVQDQRGGIVTLMGGTTEGDTEGGAGWDGGLHECASITIAHVARDFHTARAKSSSGIVSER